MSLHMWWESPNSGILNCRSLSEALLPWCSNTTRLLEPLSRTRNLEPSTIGKIVQCFIWCTPRSFHSPSVNSCLFRLESCSIWLPGYCRTVPLFHHTILVGPNMELNSTYINGSSNPVYRLIAAHATRSNLPLVSYHVTPKHPPADLLAPEDFGIL